MTRYEQGFMNKCAEYGVDENIARYLAKQAMSVGAKPPPPGMLGRKKSGGIRSLIEGVYKAMPTPFVRVGPGGFRPITNGDMDELTRGMSPLRAALARLNPNYAILSRKRPGTI